MNAIVEFVKEKKDAVITGAFTVAFSLLAAIVGSLISKEDEPYQPPVETPEE